MPFLISCTRTHFRMAEFGCLASMPLRRNTGRHKQCQIVYNDFIPRASGGCPCGCGSRRPDVRAMMENWRGLLTSSPERCPSRESSRRTASSTRCPGSRGRNPCRARAAHGAACAACDPLQDRESSCKRRCSGAVSGAFAAPRSLKPLKKPYMARTGST